MSSFFGKKNQAKNKDAKSAKEIERMKKEGMADFQRRAKAFWPEWLELRKKHAVDFGIVWDYDIIQGPRPQVVPIDANTQSRLTFRTDRFHQSTNCLSNSPLFADHKSHI